MSLITRCPTCETMFRVVPDQLRVSEGWVRCGQCAEVFDATQNMVPPDDAGAPPGGGAPSPAPAAPAPSATSRQAPPPGVAAAAASGAAARAATDGAGTWADRIPAAADAGAPEPEPTRHVQPGLRRNAEEPPAPRFDRHDDDDDDDNAPAARFVAGREPDWHEASHTDPTTVIEPRDDADTDSVDTLPPPELDFPPVPPTTPAVDAAPERERDPLPPPSFLHDDNSAPSVWQRPMVRIALVGLLVLLVALLVMQFLVKERDRVAAMQPAMRPMLEAVCAVAGCSIAPLRQIESIVIDSSSFSRVRGDDYRLGFALKNTAPIDVAMPAIEISLTDPRDEAVIRRVILPSEFGARSAALASASIWTGSLALTVQPEVAAQRIAGYRLLAFYP